MAKPAPSLSAVCAANVVQTKWLLAPSYRVGHQWIETLVRNGQSIVNLRPTTLVRLALELVGDELAENKLTLISGELGALVVNAAWRQLEPGGYLGRLQPSAELSATVHQSLIALRLAGAGTSEIVASKLGIAAKAADLAVLLTAYEAFLAQHALVDEADLLRRAIARLRAEPAAVGQETLVLVPEGLAVTGMEHVFMEALPAAQGVVIRHPAERNTTEPANLDIQLLASIGDGAADSKRQHDGSVQFFRSIGEVNEIREVLRRCLAQETPLDQVEPLHTDSETYLPLIYATARRYFSEPDLPEGIPVTFAEGISTALSRPGRALASWLRWIDEGYPQRLLVEMIGEGLLQCGDDEEMSFSYLVKLLRPLAIGLGSGNYLPKLDEQIKALRKRASDPSKTPDDDSDPAVRQRMLKGWESLRKSIASLLKLSNEIETGQGSTILAAAVKFLTKSARSISELDRYAAESLVEQVQARQIWLERLGLELDPRKWLAALPSQTRVMGSGPRPGHLHVAHVGSGGHSGRSRTFVVGLDDRRFPGAALQDPILLDAERVRLSLELATSATILRQKVESLATMLGRLSGSLTLSWPCVDLKDDRETFPCSFLLSAYRLVGGQHDADLESLNAAVGPPASFAPTTADKALDESERWLWRLSDEDIRGTDQMELVEAHYPHLARGNESQRRRATEFGPFNSYVPLAGKSLDPFDPKHPALSASALETAGRCPRAFFFRNGLSLFAPDEMEIDEDRWLDAKQVGLLMHDVFRQFMAELAGAQQRPDFNRDHQRLADVLQAAVKQARRDTPPPNENAYRVQYWQLVRTASIFLQVEEQFCQSSQPRFFEVAIGVDRVGDGGPLDCEKPISVTLPAGRSILAKGQIDRVDQIGDKQFSVWDYKISSGYGYEARNPFQQGRRLQNVLYRQMVEQGLQEKVDPSARVELFGYFFPSIRADGRRVAWKSADLASGLAVLEKLCTSIAEGAFPATDDVDDCKYCDYQAICGDVSEVAAWSKQLLGRGLVQLKHFQELRDG